MESTGALPAVPPSAKKVPPALALGDWEEVWPEMGRRLLARLWPDAL